MGVEDYLDDFTRRDWQVAEEGRIRIAVLGLGTFAVNRALPGLREAALCEPAVLVSGSAGKATDIANRFDVDVAIDYEAFLDGAAAERYDAVYVATPPAYHREYVEAAAGLGKHVLCEKPIAATIEDAERMVEACDRHDVVLMTAYRLRTEPAVRRVREMVADGLIGRVIHVNGTFSTSLAAYEGTDTWRLDPAIAGGGALVDVGIHPLNLGRFLLAGEPTAVWGETASVTAPFDRVEEHASFSLSFESATTMTGFASFNGHPDNRLHLLGTAGQILIREPFGGKVSQELVIDHRESRTEYTGTPVDEVIEEFDYFANCLLTDSPCEADGRDGLIDLRIVNAIYEAAATGTRSHLDIDPRPHRSARA